MGATRWVGREGPREKMHLRGSAALSDAEVLALLLGTGFSGAGALEVAQLLLGRFAGLHGVIAASGQQLAAERGLGPAKIARLQAAMELARRVAKEALQRGAVISSPEQTRQFLSCHLGARERETFSCLWLDSQHALINCEDLFVGTLDGAAVYPREVVRRALELGCAAVIFAHNHPSGVAEPSQADRRITERLQAALALVDIRVLDHVIVGRGQQYSFAEAGLI